MREYKTNIARIESLLEMDTAMTEELARVRAKHGFQEGDRAIFPRHLAHYVLAHYFNQPPEVRDEILVEGRATMEERRRSRKPIFWDINPEPEVPGEPGATTHPGTIRAAPDADRCGADGDARPPGTISGRGPNPKLKPPRSPKRGAASS